MRKREERNRRKILGKGGTRKRKAAERGKQEVKKKENEWEKMKKGKNAWGKGRKKLEDNKRRGKTEMQVDGRRKGRKENE